MTIWKDYFTPIKFPIKRKNLKLDFQIVLYQSKLKKKLINI